MDLILELNRIKRTELLFKGKDDATLKSLNELAFKDFNLVRNTDFILILI
jgi:hypothetical protein